MVVAQLEGLAREPASGPPGAGLAQCWAYASPGNRSATGPLERFAELLRNPVYRGLLGHRAVHLGPVEVSGPGARQEVLVMTADDEALGFTWVLSRQTAPPYAGCWMTDGVLRHPDAAVSGELVRRDEVGALVGQLSDERLDRRERGRVLTRLMRALTGGLRRAGVRAAASGAYLTEIVTDLAPHVPVRDLLVLREHYDGLSGDELADALVQTAATVTAGIGAAGGALASAQAAAPPTLLAAPVQLVAETVAVVAVELKLVAELHVVYGRTPRGTPAEQAAAYLTAWASKRGIDIRNGPPSLGAVLGTAARQQLRARLVRRLGRNVSTLAPFLAGALAGAELNRRETRSLGEALLRDLHRR